MTSAAIASLPTLESAWVDNLQCSSHTLAEDNLSYVTKGTRELQRQAHDIILQQRDSQQSTVCLPVTRNLCFGIKQSWWWISSRDRQTINLKLRCHNCLNSYNTYLMYHSWIWCVLSLNMSRISLKSSGCTDMRMCGTLCMWLPRSILFYHYEKPTHWKFTLQTGTISTLNVYLYVYVLLWESCVTSSCEVLYLTM